MSDKLDKLIADISDKASDKKPAYNVEKSFISWLALTIFYLIIMSSIFGIKNNLLERIISDGFYTIEIFCLSLIVITSLYSCANLAVPDANRKKYILRLPLYAIIVFLADIVFFCLLNESSESINHMRGLICIGCIILSSLIPAIFLFFQISRAAPTKLKLTAFYIFLYATSLSALVLRLEEVDHPIYENILYHYLPILVLSLSGIFTAKKFLKW